MALKQCQTCPPGLLKPTSEFWVNRTGRTADGLMSRCKVCSTAARKSWITAAKESEYNHRRYLKDPERRCAEARAWAEANPERARENKRRRESNRRAIKMDAFVEHIDPLVVLEFDDNACGICGGDVDPMNFHIDHIIPLARGGEHSYANAQVAHPTCNVKKGARL